MQDPAETHQARLLIQLGWMSAEDVARCHAAARSHRRPFLELCVGAGLLDAPRARQVFARAATELGAGDSVLPPMLSDDAAHEPAPVFVTEAVDSIPAPDERPFAGFSPATPQSAAPRPGTPHPQALQPATRADTPGSARPMPSPPGSGTSGSRGIRRPGSTRPSGSGPGSGSGSGVKVPKLEPGDVIAGMVVTRLLGRGGMGAVYEAQLDGRKVALKMLERIRGTALERFRREAEVMQSLDDPGIVRCVGAGVDADWPWLAMELVDGESLDHRIIRGQPLETHEAVQLIARIARSLAVVHAEGVLHRDLKPSNVLVRSSDGRPLLTDFGLARNDAAEMDHLTRTQEVLGTPHYMSPEQAGAERDKMGPATDVWALGVMLYELLSGIRPFEADSAVELTSRILLQDPPPLRRANPAVPRDLAALVERLLNKDPSRRPAALELADSLDMWLHSGSFERPEVVWRRRVGRSLSFVVGSFIVSLLVLGGWRFVRGRSAAAERTRRRAIVRRALDETSEVLKALDRANSSAARALAEADGALARKALEPARKGAAKLDGILAGLGAAVREELASEATSGRYRRARIELTLNLAKVELLGDRVADFRRAVEILDDAEASSLNSSEARNDSPDARDARRLETLRITLLARAERRLGRTLTAWRRLESLATAGWTADSALLAELRLELGLVKPALALGERAERSTGDPENPETTKASAEDRSAEERRRRIRGLALVRSGRRQEGLSCLREVATTSRGRRALARSLGAEPGPDGAELFEALQILRRRLIEQAGDVPATLALAELLARHGRIRDARDQLKAIVRRVGDPRALQARIAALELLMPGPKLREAALASLATVAADERATPQDRARALRLRVSLGADIGEARGDLTELTRTLLTPGGDDGDALWAVRLRHLLARVLAPKERRLPLDGAGRARLAALAESGLPEALGALALIAVEDGDVEAARKHVTASLALDPGEPKALAALARVEPSRGADERATAALLAAELPISTLAREARRLLGQALGYNRPALTKRAQNLLADFRALAPWSGVLAAEELRLLRMTGSADAAKRGLKLCALAPGSAGTLGLTALILDDAGRYDESGELAARAAAIDPRPAVVQLVLARAASRARDREACFKAIERALESEPANVEVLKFQRRVLEAIKDKDAVARVDARLAFLTTRDAMIALRDKALAMSNEGDGEAALKVLEPAIRDRPRCGELYLERVHAHLALQRTGDHRFQACLDYARVFLAQPKVLEMSQYDFATMARNAIPIESTAESIVARFEKGETVSALEATLALLHHMVEVQDGRRRGPELRVIPGLLDRALSGYPAAVALRVIQGGVLVALESPGAGERLEDTLLVYPRMTFALFPLAVEAMRRRDVPRVFALMEAAAERTEMLRKIKAHKIFRPLEGEARWAEFGK